METVMTMLVTVLALMIIIFIGVILYAIGAWILRKLVPTKVNTKEINNIKTLN